MTAEAPALLGTEHYIYRKDGKVYVHRVGDGDPVVFLHSVSSHAAAWKHTVKHLICKQGVKGSSHLSS